MNKIEVKLKVKASAKQNKIEGFIVYGAIKMLKINVKATPENGKANSELIKFLAKELGLAQKYIEITSGHYSCYKTVIIEGENVSNDIFCNLS